MRKHQLLTCIGLMVGSSMAGVAPVALAGPTAKPGAAEGEHLTDAQILAVADTANTGEVDQAKVALEKAQADSVKSFAKLMIKDHSMARDKGVEIAKELGVTPKPNPVSTQVKNEGDALVTKLRSEPEANFDREYMTAQVKLHEKVLKMIDGRLLPNATASQVKSLLGEMRTHVEHHLAVARSTLRSL